MKKHLLAFAVLAFISLTANAQKVKFEEFDLDNGLHVIMHQDNTAPVVTIGVMYNVGGKDLGGDNNPKRTGFAHFFEHLLFEGTENIERGKWMEIVSSNGGKNNANTSLDRTYFYEVFPSNNLELGLWMESERMLHPVINQIGVDTQNEVVKEEKRSSYDNRPYSQFVFAIDENLFKVHPYKYKNIGEMEDLDAATLEEFKDYFKKYYVPNNAVLVIAGDIDTSKAKTLVSNYFKDIPKGKEVVRNFPKEEPITKEIHAKFYDPNIKIPAIMAAYRIPGFKERDSYVLQMISTYLSDGKTSKLYKKIVDDKKMALQAGAININQLDYGVYVLYGLPLGDNSLNSLVSEMDEEIVKIQNDLISEKDFQKIQNKLENQFVNSNSSVEGIANSLATDYLLYGDTNLINNEINIYKSITREEIQKVAKKYLNPNQRVLLEYLPKENEQ
ncbi:pitrilysin family protein [Yeosuana marina]|uniref:M16 family metallopeptidase n=1 Tax=Yeosuana marina TaxID=1565536 RepID=UPI0030EF48A2|tara:strand:+ start:625 stop:1956 length:1332 start_codon:yes stop_codon:yes gene_type:complete